MQRATDPVSRGQRGAGQGLLVRLDNANLRGLHPLVAGRIMTTDGHVERRVWLMLTMVRVHGVGSHRSTDAFLGRGALPGGHSCVSRPRR